jgi:hypothetical protein
VGIANQDVKLKMPLGRQLAIDWMQWGLGDWTCPKPKW